VNNLKARVYPVHTDIRNKSRFEISQASPDHSTGKNSTKFKLGTEH
jgi:hypothetical protein